MLKFIVLFIYKMSHLFDLVVMWGTDNSLLSLMSISAYTTYLTTKYTKILTLSTKSYKIYARFNLRNKIAED